MIRTAVLMLAAALVVVADNGVSVGDYGVDCTFPIHHADNWKCDQFRHRKAVYEEFMQGCRDNVGKKASACDRTEEDRLEMSLNQPQSMVVRRAAQTAVGYPIRSVTVTHFLLSVCTELHFYRFQKDSCSSRSRGPP